MEIATGFNLKIGDEAEIKNLLRKFLETNEYDNKMNFIINNYLSKVEMIDFKQKYKKYISNTNTKEQIQLLENYFYIKKITLNKFSRGLKLVIDDVLEFDFLYGKEIKIILQDLYDMIKKLVDKIVEENKKIEEFNNSIDKFFE